MFSNLQNYGSCIKIRVSNFISIPRDPAKLCMLVCRCCGSSSELREISMTHFKFVCTRIEIKRGLLFNIVLSFTRWSHPLGAALRVLTELEKCPANVPTDNMDPSCLLVAPEISLDRKITGKSGLQWDHPCTYKSTYLDTLGVDESAPLTTRVHYTSTRYFKNDDNKNPIKR